MRLIDADALIPLIKMGECNMYNEYCQGRNGGIEFAVNQVKQLPTIEPERKTGRWLPQNHNRRNGYVTTTVYYYPKCSECGHSGNYGMNYCPHCGAYMGGEEDGSD